MREDEILNNLFKFYKPNSRVILGPGDDGAILSEIVNKNLIITTDAFIENIHFKGDLLSLYEIGYKATNAVLSDIAAMGGIPLAVVISLNINQKSINRIDEIYKGILDVCNQFCISIVGGNIEKYDRLELHITAIGEVNRDSYIPRNNAKPGDIIAITGDLGRAKGYFISYEKNLITGLKWWINDMREKFSKPNARINEMKKILSNIKVNACIDISDGLGIDGYRMANSSEVQIIIYADKLPIKDSVKYLAKKLDIKDWFIAVESGEEYELLLSIPREEAPKIEKLELPITIIGEVIEDKPGIYIIDSDLKIDISKRGYDAFAN
ncbi:MAG: thiamine-phosphate kinase [candidate division WOR-3 bacterium]